ncbi:MULTISPECIES: hypothetical protein [Clostridium]|uniref:Iron-only hydrogenase system regulator n=1 Tax=Clostridium intestinale DSM 6191 TaxID=1121320 RepID=A0A1M5U9I2_9CLOT|nr:MULTISPECIES: hypothetical protein [Clostridium]SHH59561.1 hypothetical protein SAMN02745941_00449 [Clostridium intestinale DSM 6191]
METTIMALSIDPRTAHAPQVQTVLTKHGCAIKTRLGLHEASEDSCSQKGLILLHLSSDLQEVKELEDELIDIDGVRVKYMTL